MLTMFHGVRVRLSQWRFLVSEWCRSQRIEARAKRLARDNTLFSLQAIHGHRLNRLKQWTLATESMTPNPLFSRTMLDRALHVERRLVKEADLAIRLKSIEIIIDDAADQIENSQTP